MSVVNLDLRSWLAQVKQIGELESVAGAERDEIGAICETWESEAQALLFDQIPRYSAGYRVLTNAVNSPNRIALAFGMEPGLGKTKLVAQLRDKLAALQPVSPVLSKDGAVLQNVWMGDQVDLTKFPAPLWHKGDGGHYIGTGDLGIMKDPDSGWVNFGCYRAVVHDSQSTGFVATRGHHGSVIMQKYWDRGMACPMALCIGHHPLLFMMSGIDVPFGVSEYEWAGALAGNPVEVVESPFSHLPIPACGELVLDGEMIPGELRDEGPFGEWAGYYTTDTSCPRPVFRVKAICFRDDPIIFGAMPGRLPNDNTYYFSVLRSALVLNELTRASIPGIQAAWEHTSGGGRMFLVVSLKQAYPGHSAQTAQMAASCYPAAYSNRVTIVVDDDIVPHDLDQVMWAVCTRADLKTGVTILHNCWTSPADPTHYSYGDSLDFFNSRIIINATRPWERRNTFPPVCGLEAGEREALKIKWADLFSRRRQVG